jgi:SHS family lactate transporter-like MFS transporter
MAFGTTVFALMMGSCVMHAGGQGAFGVIPAHVNELSPASVRVLFPGFVYQLGVLVASPATNGGDEAARQARLFLGSHHV